MLGRRTHAITVEKAVLVSGRVDAQFRAQLLIHQKIMEGMAAAPNAPRTSPRLPSDVALTAPALALPSPSAFLPRGAGGGAPGRAASVGHIAAQEPFRVDMLLPNDMVGRIIGKKGAQVRQISDMSGARLIINRDARFPVSSALLPMARSASADTADSASSFGESSSDDLPLRMRRDDTAHASAESTVITIVGRFEAALIAQQYIRELVHYHRAPERAGLATSL